MTMINRPTTPIRVLPFVLLILLHVAGLGLLFLLPDGIWPISRIGGRLRIATGLVHGEIAVIAAWAAWSQMTLALRLPLAILGSLISAAALHWIIDSSPTYTPIEVSVQTFGSGLIQCLLVLGMCRAARAFGIDWRNTQ